MDLDQNSEFENVETEQITEVETQEPIETVNEELPTEEPKVLDEDGNEVEAQTEWTPDFKYKAYGKEYEIPEEYRGFINQENYDSFKKLFEKSGGFEPLKEKYEGLKSTHTEIEEKFNQTQTEYDNIVNAINSVEQNINNGDFEQVFKTLNISEDALFQYVADRIAYKNMSPEERQNVDQTLNLRRQNELLQSQTAYQQQMYEQTLRNQHEMEVNMLLHQPQYQEVISGYNDKVKDPNAFRNIFEAIGSQEFTRTGQQPMLQDVFQKTINYLGLNQAEVTPTEAIQTESIQTNVSTPSPKPIPTHKGSGVTPIKKQFNSFEELEKYAESI